MRRARSGTIMSSTASTRASFDAKAKSYESGRLAGWYKAQAELVVQHAQLHAGDAALDVGCGTGWLLRRMAQRFSGITGLGLDLSPRMIERARELARVEAIGRLSFVAGDWMDIDPQLLVQANGIQSVDLVCCVSTFHYFSDPAVALNKMFQVTGPGGRLLLLDRARNRSLFTLVWELLHRAVLRDIVRFYRVEELLALVEGAGYERAEAAASVHKLFWKGKLATSLVLVEARRP